MSGNIINEYDTIAAISTPPGVGAISIVRLSGENSIEIANKIFKGKNLFNVPNRNMVYGHIIDPDNNNEVIDEVMLTVMRAPKTYTRENIVEVNTHGGLVVTQKILELMLSNGARMAEPGEFTKRAFLNGRIDLTQAESIENLIDAKSERSRQVAIDQLGGGLRDEINDLRNSIMNVMGKVEVNIDYPEYDEEQVTLNLMKQTAIKIKEKILNLLSTVKDGEILQNGILTALIGKPNVGKSSLLNCLIHQDKAIVTNIAGTTRDTLEEYININGVPLRLIDTAGIRNTENEIEKIGVQRSKNMIDRADLVILIIDSSVKLDDEDYKLLKYTKNKQRIIILNKIDLKQKVKLEDLKNFVKNDEVLSLSILHNFGLNNLKNRIVKIFDEGLENNSQNMMMITNARQSSLLKKALSAIEDLLDGIDKKMPIDLVQIDLTNCWNILGEITGDSSPDEMINELFSRFCLGK